METPFELWKAGQLRTFHQVQVVPGGQLIQSRQVDTPLQQVATPVRQAATPIRQAATPVRRTPVQARRILTDVRQDLDDLEKGTEIFQQMLLTGKLPWVPEQLKPQAANFRAFHLTEQASNETMSQRSRNHVPRRPLSLNPEATEFHTTQSNSQLSKSATSEEPQSEVSARNYTLSAALERIEMLEIEVAALEDTIKEHCETYTCRKVESQSESELRFPKQFSEGSSLLYLHQLEVDGRSSSNLIEL